MKYRFRGLLTNDGWIQNASVNVDEEGIIKSIIENDDSGEFVNGLALPGFQNAHSHAFQYAMAGIAEIHPAARAADDFWSWRNAMYDIALTISPSALYEVATVLYRQMLRHGYTSVAEFHYLHHDPNGNPYANISEMGEQLLAAAHEVGIKITLIPMFYQRGGFGKPAESGQRRFISENAEAYNRLLQATRDSVRNYPDARMGMGVHSLRAVDGDLIQEIFNNADPDLPLHIHISEQKKEVAECMAFYGRRPVEWLLENCNVNENVHLVHATHLSDDEVTGITQSGAHVVLCPSTEGNLGDGLFRFHDFKQAGGKWSIGTDSHIGLNPFEELRLLDYGQRLTTHSRNTFVLDGNPDSGRNAIDMALLSGRRAMGWKENEYFRIGNPLDAVVINAETPLLSGSVPGQWCSTIVYTSDASDVVGTLVNGRWSYRIGSHPDESTAIAVFQKLRK